MNRKKASPFEWWLRCIAHNVLVHPWLPLADALDALGCRAVPRAIYWAHDWTARGLEGGG